MHMAAKKDEGTLVEVGPLAQDASDSSNLPSVSKVATPDLDFPEGGFQGWMTVLGGFV